MEDAKGRNEMTDEEAAEWEESYNEEKRWQEDRKYVLKRISSARGEFTSAKENLLWEAMNGVVQFHYDVDVVEEAMGARKGDLHRLIKELKL